jgi:hypothetical protein
LKGLKNKFLQDIQEIVERNNYTKNPEDCDISENTSAFKVSPKKMSLADPPIKMTPFSASKHDSTIMGS